LFCGFRYATTKQSTTKPQLFAALSVFMIIDFFISVVIGIPVIFISVVAYVHVLLAIAKVFSGIIKFVISMMVYLVFALIVALPMFYLISQNQPAVQESIYSLIAVIFSYCLIMAPAFYYLGKVKIKELQIAGYFLPRR
jgi:hypothetical protein